MNLHKKIISSGLIGCIVFPIASVFALTNKEATLSIIDTLNTSIVTSISEKEKLLSDSANDLGNRYDVAIKALGFQSDEVETLTSIKKFNVPAFRQDVTQAYLTLKQDIFQDIKATQSSLASLHDEISLGYTDLSGTQKQLYDAKIADSKTQYSAFLSGSTASILNFTATFSGSIASNVNLVAQMMRDNSDYIRFIRDIRSGFSWIDGKKTNFLAKKDTLENQILPKIQGGFLAFTTNKKTFTDAIRKDLTGGLEKALVHDRLKRQETELRAYIEDIMSKWGEYLKQNFSQDDNLLYASKDAENIIISEKALRSRIYDENGNIRTLDMTGSSAMIADITKIDSNLTSNAAILDALIWLYGTGNTLSSLNDALINAYIKELTTYRADFTKLLEERLNTALLEEKNLSQTLSLLDSEEKILKHNLETVTSADFTETLVNDFIAKIEAFAKVNGQSDVWQKAQALKYHYMRVVAQKKIEDEKLVPYYGLRSPLDTEIAKLFASLEQKVGKTFFVNKLPIVLTKIDKLLSNTTLSPKKRYSLLVVQSNTLKYLEDAFK